MKQFHTLGHMLNPQPEVGGNTRSFPVSLGILYWHSYCNDFSPGRLQKILSNILHARNVLVILSISKTRSFLHRQCISETSEFPASGAIPPIPADPLGPRVAHEGILRAEEGVRRPVQRLPGVVAIVSDLLH
uniref:Uncharacterized protein n=1 Tax=Odontella aurita TaxID=265563 RepID=A0A7S4MN32_9STRA|mmetsp:Transcript_26468/g.78315  ORF Transcript_26468/g.78315 Transcript_26468/m.78315 type:complete len:132 (+) Transcript_26468:138-533(+)